MTDFDARAREIAHDFVGCACTGKIRPHSAACDILTAAISSALKEAVEEERRKASQRVKELEEAIKPFADAFTSGETVEAGAWRNAHAVLCQADASRADSQSAAQALPSNQSDDGEAR